MNHQYMFHLGREVELCGAEIFYFLKKEVIKFTKLWQYKNLVAIEFDKEIDVDYFQDQLGGTVKISLILAKKSANGFNEEILIGWLDEYKKEVNDKYFFGLSLISDNKMNERKKMIERAGLTWKKILRDRGVASRFVVDRNPELSSVTVTKNKLLSAQGQEFYLIFLGSDIYLSTTLTCQNFADYSFRDYHRPARDQYSGMIPPKLARMMINIAGVEKDKKILDPFCGSGTIITEAMLMGYKNLIASDISQKAVDDTKKNIAWIQEKYNNKIKPEIFLSSADNILDHLAVGSVDAIVAEPYLGKPLRGHESLAEIKKQREELVKLYNKSLIALSQILKPNGAIVMILPVFRIGKERGFIYLEQILAGTNLKVDKMSDTQRGTLSYEREDQKVGREILRLIKSHNP